MAVPAHGGKRQLMVPGGRFYEKTVILFTSDHGEQFWEYGASLHGHTLYEEEIRIPAILFVPGIQRRFEDVPIIAADMVPTIAELEQQLLGYLKRVEGKTYRPLLTSSLSP